MEDITYRLAEMKDCLTLSKLKEEIWNTTYRGIYPDEKIDGYDIKRNTATFEILINNPHTDLYAVADCKEIIGFMSCGKPYRPFRAYQQEIGLLYIRKEYQRKGIGKALFIIGMNKIRENGSSNFFVSVNKYNKNALYFYISMGGKIIHVDEDKENKSEAQIKLHYSI